MVKSVHQPLRHYSQNVWTPCSLVCEMIGLDFDFFDDLPLASPYPLSSPVPSLSPSRDLLYPSLALSPEACHDGVHVVLVVHVIPSP